MTYKVALSTTLLFFYSVLLPAWASPAVIHVNQDSIDTIIPVYALLATDEKVDADEVSRQPMDKWQYNVSADTSITLPAGVHWLSFDLANTTREGKAIYLVLKSRLQLVDIQLYSDVATHRVKPIPLQLNSGNVYAGLLQLAPESSMRLFLRVDSLSQLTLPVHLYDEKAFYQLNSSSQFHSGLVIGGMLALALAVPLLFFSSGLKSTLLLFGYFISRAILLSVILGGNLHFLMPQIPELRVVELPILTVASSIFMLLFTLELFSLKTVYPRLAKFMVYLCGALIIYGLSSLAFSITLNFWLSIIIHSIVTFCLILVGCYLIKKSHQLATLYTLTLFLQLISFVLGVTLMQLYDLGDINNKAILYGLSFWLNALLILLILSRQYYYHLDDKQKIQRQALDSAIATRQAHEELLALQQDNQEKLEIRVQERTLELNIALQELENSNHELAQKNTEDDLSGLNNRRFYDQKIIAEYRRSKRNLTPLSLVLIDIDYFKMVNDNHGHLAGDQCIHWLGLKIKDHLKRSSDIGCRYGGEEFCLILPDTDTEGAFTLAEELRLSVQAASFKYNDLVIDISISCGVSTYRQEMDVDPKALFSAADKALYLAKTNGRNQSQQHIFTAT